MYSLRHLQLKNLQVKYSFCFVLSVFLLSSCSSNHIPIISKETNVKHEALVKVSYYGIPGGPLHNKLTASGEPFDPELHTAAHRDLPFGSILKVQNPKNRSWVIVRVNDRGPGINGRELDLSYGAAKALGILNEGICSLKVVLLSKDKLKIKPQNKSS